MSPSSDIRLGWRSIRAQEKMDGINRKFVRVGEDKSCEFNEKNHHIWMWIEWDFCQISIHRRVNSSEIARLECLNIEDVPAPATQKMLKWEWNVSEREEKSKFYTCASFYRPTTILSTEKRKIHQWNFSLELWMSLKCTQSFLIFIQRLLALSLARQNWIFTCRLYFFTSRRCEI